MCGGSEFRLTADRQFERTHTFELSAAVAKRLSTGYFAGLELRALTRCVHRAFTTKAPLRRRCSISAAYDLSLT